MKAAFFVFVVYLATGMIIIVYMCRGVCMHTLKNNSHTVNMLYKA